VEIIIGFRAEGRESKDTMPSHGYQMTSPVLGENGRLHGLGSWRGRREPQELP